MTVFDSATRPRDSTATMRARIGSRGSVRVLVSVRDEAEACQVAAAGVALIDLKDPTAGALGGLPVERIRAVLAALREARASQLVSATIGDFASNDDARILERVSAVAGSGVDLVKVGVAPGQGASTLLHALTRCGACVVPVLLADDGIAFDLVDLALGLDAFPAVMLDLAGKRSGSLLQRLPLAHIARYIAAARARGTSCGVAGALMLDDVDLLRSLRPDFAGFRSAVCVGDRAGVLEASRVIELRRKLAAT